MSLATTRLRHDLRTAVNHVLGYGEMLLEEAEAVGSPEIEALRGIRHAALDALGVIDAELGGSGAAAHGVAGLRAALRGPATRLLEIIHALEATASEPDAADLRRMATGAGTLLRFAEDGVAALGNAPRPPATWTPSGDTAAAVHAAPPSRILVADDDATNRDLLGRRLARDGHTVTFAADGRAALGLLQAGGQDLVLLDLLMPELDGYEVLRQMKASPALRDLPVLMISANGEHASVGPCIAIGADDYLSKPFDPVLLRARLAACLERKRARDRELEYLRQVRLLTSAAGSIETGTFEPGALAEVAARPDALGGLARVLERAAREVQAREQRLTVQVHQLRIEIDEARKASAVAEIVETDYFHDLQRRAAELRRPFR